MHCGAVALIVTVVASSTVDLSDLPRNTWVEIPYVTEQPTGATEKGAFARQGWNKLVYDPLGQRVLFYDRWVDKHHGGQTIYGNCLFALDPATARLTPLKIDNWTKIDTPTGGYRTKALPENKTEPTPCPRHVYHAFEYVPDRNAVYLCNGANQTVIDDQGTLVGHDECDGVWKLDLKSNRWSRIEGGPGPVNRLDEAMAYCPDIQSLIYSAADGQLWILELQKEKWRKSQQSPPRRTSMGRTIFYDAPRNRMLLAGGGNLDAWMKGPAPEFREVYAFDPRSEAVTRLADAPTALYSSHLAHDTKRDLWFAVAVFNKKEQPSGMFAYHPRADSWREIQTANPIPPHNNWFGWMQLCYAAHDDCLVGKINDTFFALRYEPAK